MKKGINLWSVSWPGLTRELTNEELAIRIKEMGYDGVELTFDDREVDPTRLPESVLEDIAKSFKSQGLEVPSVATGVFWKYNLGAQDAQVRSEGVRYGKAGVRMASLAGASSILVVPGVASPEVPYEIIYENATRSVREIAEYAEDYNITVAVENVWNKFLYSPIEFKRFIAGVDMKNVKAYLDVANLVAISHPENWIYTLRGLISNVHAKDFDVSIGNTTGFRHMLKGSIDWKRIAGLLKSSGYDGYLMLECPPDFDPSLESPSLADALRKAKENCDALEEIIRSI